MASTLETQAEERSAELRSAGDPADTVALHRQALALWLEWNRAYETVTAQMYASRVDVTAVQEMMDRMDDIRRRAVEMSRMLVGDAGSQ